MAYGGVSPAGGAVSSTGKLRFRIPAAGSADPSVTCGITMSGMLGAVKDGPHPVCPLAHYG